VNARSILNNNSAQQNTILAPRLKRGATKWIFRWDIPVVLIGSKVSINVFDYIYRYLTEMNGYGSLTLLHNSHIVTDLYTSTNLATVTGLVTIYKFWINTYCTQYVLLQMTPTSLANMFRNNPECVCVWACAHLKL
jgi:phage terminase large subunit GpA-like protein